ncbi:unnamed protein product [Acanthoscelides obtectus]|uniref:MADF domain-containing protein n=1 Tax=Acanthoscelides obtectus TaxID=200917 RepID=A0A9P0L4H7_ACAOB|nr:unnamed protein product [Acanthoscelides obtectus]CAH1983332.1 unnamed protein product [Acanthoscelides obtectus]CAH1985569.1 unnamed protein product [Acanthoscelides obtectus]CAH1989331.1 unnamed protein product [Acanthoscelides obtectus]CAK1643964.1 hypothetical protein AOBTE_LOCUS13751 [Acanthoscelides obtectus]
MANQRWTADKNIQFINEYQRNECLWDPKHPDYKNRDARDAGYKAIMEVMQMESVKDVICKIRTLRNTYNNEVMKTKKSNTTGMATDEQYISKIPWIPHMDFLKNTDGYARENTENLTPNTASQGSASGSSNDEFTIPRTPTRNKRKIADPLLKAVHTLEQISSQHVPNAGNDEFALFGQTVAQQLRQLPLEIALETEEIILSTIRRQRISSLKQQSLSQRNSSPPRPKSTASASSAINNDKEDANPTGYNNDVLSQAIASITERELDFDEYF